jgi:hypothetical protein
MIRNASINLGFRGIRDRSGLKHMGREGDRLAKRGAHLTNLVIAMGESLSRDTPLPVFWKKGEHAFEKRP